MKRAIALLGAVALAACDSSGPTDFDEMLDVPSLAVSSGHSFIQGGNPDFFFLPPILPHPNGHPNHDENEFNPNLVPTVEACELDLATLQCTGLPLATIVGNLFLRFELYWADWRVEAPQVDPDKFYRVRVLVGGVELGFLDVDPFPEGTTPPARTLDFFPIEMGSILPLRFRIENGALCDPTAAECASTTVDADDGAQVTLSLGDGVELPPQPQGFPGGQQQVTFTVQMCAAGETLPLDIPLFGECLEIFADPPLDGDLDVPATVSVCTDLGNTGLPHETEELITLHRWDVEDGTDVIVALPHADDDCVQTGANAGARPGVFARGWSTVRDLFAPEPLMASTAVVRLDRGRGGLTSGFSKFQHGLPAKMEKLNGDGHSGPEGQLLGFEPSVLVTDLNDEPVAGATVHFLVTQGGGSVQPASAVTGANGVARVDGWTLGTPGVQILEFSGFGLAVAGNDGPRAGFDPFQPIDLGNPALETGVSVLVGILNFQATATASPDSDR